MDKIYMILVIIKYNMSGKTYILKEDFKGYTKGKKFTRINKYGDNHKYSAKLEEKDVKFRPKTIEVTEKELFMNFESVGTMIIDK